MGIISENIRVGELGDDTEIPCGGFCDLHTKRQSASTNQNRSSRTESSVKVRCREFNVNSMLSQSVRNNECEVRCISFRRTRSILILYRGVSTLTYSHEPYLTITKEYA